jgi:hypothetical protein
MERAACSLPVSRAPVTPGLPELHFLTGRKFWYQTAFCLHSLQFHSGLAFRPVFHDDGSLGETIAARLLGLFPHARIERVCASASRVAALLPPDRFPAIHAELRRVHPNFRKLTDVHVGATGYRVVLDSDMLFFRRPDFLIEWLQQPRNPLYMLDVADAYGYSKNLMTTLAGHSPPPCVNVGFCGFNSSEIDWARLESWCRQLVAAEGTHYYIEQAVSAMLFAGRPCAIAPRPDYLVMPDAVECRAPTAVLHHYVADSKCGYFRHAWRVALAQCRL